MNQHHGPFHLSTFQFPSRLAGFYRVLDVDIAPTWRERIVPPAGEDHAFDFQHYRRRVQVSVSPTWRSVRVFVDGNEVRS